MASKPPRLPRAAAGDTLGHGTAEAPPQGGASELSTAAPSHPSDRVEQALEAFAPEPELTSLRGSTVLLDVLDDLEAGHPARAGLRVKLYHRRPDGRTCLVPMDWEQELPTEDRVSQLVAAGHLPPGDYHVALRKGGATAPPVRFTIAPLGQAPSASADPVSLALRVVEAVRGAPALPAPEAQASDLAELTAAVEQLGERLGALERMAGELAAGSAKGGAGSAIVQGLMDRLLAAPAAPERAPAPAAAPGVPAGMRR